MIHWLYLVYCITVNAYTGKILLSGDRFLSFCVLGAVELLLTALVLQLIIERESRRKLKSLLLKIVLSPLWIGTVILILLLFVLCKVFKQPCPSLKEIDVLEYWRL